MEHPTPDDRRHPGGDAATGDDACRGSADARGTVGGGSTDARGTAGGGSADARGTAGGGSTDARGTAGDRPDAASLGDSPGATGRTLAPRPVPPSVWLLPGPEDADEDGVVGIGADLDPPTLVDAYRRGIFPWPHPDIPLPWFSPDPRGALWPDEVHVSRSLARVLRRSGWHTTVDAAFEEVVEHCANERGAEGTWITGSLLAAYVRLHHLGWAHSLEVWDGDRLVGGVYGVQIGGVFTGESMFHRVADASKAALVDLAARFAAAGGVLIDVQLTTPHLRRMGARDLPRSQFLEHLAAVADDVVRMDVSRQPVSRLTPPAPHGDGTR